jgi:hypothetical protein
MKKSKGRKFEQERGEGRKSRKEEGEEGIAVEEE